MKKLQVLLLLVVAGLALAPGAAGAGTTTRVSVSTTEVEGNSTSNQPAVSYSGRFVAFESTATNLHVDDAETNDDIFLRDRSNTTTILVSRADGAAGANAGGVNADPAITADGGIITWQSTGTNLDAADVDATQDVYLRGLAISTTDLISRATGAGGAKGNSTSGNPDIDSGGGAVVFESIATNLDPADVDASADIFARFSSTTEYVSRATGAAGAAGNGASSNPSIGGSLIAFESTSSNLDAADADITSDIFVRDFVTNTTFYVSRATGVAGVASNGASVDADMASGSDSVAFTSTATNLDPADTDALTDIFVRDIGSSTTTLVSRASGVSGAASNGASGAPSISTNGRYVLFNSTASNLVPDDTNGIIDLFVRDLQENYTVRVSLNENGAEVFGSGLANPAISGDGRVATFESDIDLDLNDANFTTDIYARESDGDADGWLDGADNCSATANDTQLDTDVDGFGDPCDADDDNDGVPDTSDPCDLLAEDFDSFQDSDGCLDTDNDLDGILDASDSGKYCFDPAATLVCPTTDCDNVAEDLDAFKDADGCPEPDNDNDSFTDVTDACPGADASAGVDGMFGAPQDLNHNGVQDGAEVALTTDDVMPLLMWEDKDGVLDTDGCHDSPGDDFDGDGFTDDAEVFTHLTDAGNPDTDADTVIDGSDNCPNWPNAAQTLPTWTIPALDSDCDGFNKTREQHVGTDPTKHCNATVAVNDEAVDFWPTDFNDSRFTSLADVVLMGPVYNQSTGTDPAKKRFDLNASGIVSLADVVLMGPFYNKGCA